MLSDERMGLPFTIAAHLASTVILRPESLGIHNGILLSQIRDNPNLEGQVPLFLSTRNMVAQLYTQTLGSFSSPLTIRRATVEVFDPASTRGPLYNRLYGLSRKHRFQQNLDCYMRIR
jgi:hypothetical protein